MKIYAFIELCRPFTSFLTSLAVIAAILIETHNINSQIISIILISSLVVFLFSSAGNALNDYFDREIDKINHPERPIPSNRIKPESALKFSIFLFFLSTIFTFFLNFYCILIVIIAFLFQILYELKFKRHYISKNFTIAFLTGMLFIFGGTAVNKYISFLTPSTIFGIMAFFAIFGREIIKDIEDFVGDKNRLTLPKKIGIKNAGIIAGIFLLISVALSFIPYLFLDFSIIYIFFVSITDILFFYSIFIQYKNPKKSRKIIKIGMFIALIGFILGAWTKI